MSFKPPLFVRGMHGIGDNIHQRAAIRLLKQTHNVTLESSWHSLYWDLIDEDFKVVGRNVALRTQQKNALREKPLFAPPPPHHHITSAVRVSYSSGTIARTQSQTITEAMFHSAGLGPRIAEADFRFPLKDEWIAEADRIIKEWPTGDKPILIYRPLCVRPEWAGSAIRNANIGAYTAIAERLGRKFFIVSVADLEEGREWIDGPEFPADLKFHGGEFVFEILAAIMHRADLVLTSGGFAAMLGPAVGTPTISILGGYEPKEWCADSGKFSPFLCIEPVKPCRCGSSGCQNHCTKEIDLPAALDAIGHFTSMTPPAPSIGGQAMLELPAVTLLCVETRMHEMARITLADAIEKVKFAEVVIHTDKPELIPIPGARYVTVPNWVEKRQCGTYCYNDAAQSVNTSHMIFTEWDGGVRDVSAWDPAFLDYDYIGAPWPGRSAGQWDPKGFSVGNGGFTLWSRRLMDRVREMRDQFNVFTDVHISKDYRDRIIAGTPMQWAPEAIGYKFSFEHGSETQRYTPSFGYHDVFNWPLAMSKDEVERRARIMMQTPYVHNTHKVYMLAARAPWLKGKVPGFEDAQPPRPRPRLPHHGHTPQIPLPSRPPTMGPLPVRHQVTRAEYERALQARGLKA